MDPLAGKKNEDDSSLTPWELIDPDEPANGPAPKSQAEDEAEGVAAYAIETVVPGADGPQNEAGSETETVAAPAETIVASANVGQAEVPAPAAEEPVSQELWQWDHVDAVQRVDSLCTLPPLVFEAALPAQSEEAPLPAAAVIAPEPAQTDSDSLLDLRIDEALAEPTTSQTPDPSTTITTAIDPQPELTASAEAETPEMFGETIAALDAMPDTMGQIADITQAVGEAPPVEVADHAVTVQASVGPVEDIPVSADALRDVLEAASVSEPVETESAQTTSDEVAPEPETEPRPQVRAYAPPQEEKWLDEEDAEYDEAEEDDADLAEAVFTEDEADIPEPRWEDPELDGELAPVASDGGGWTIPLLCAGIAIIACCMVMPQIDANRRLAYEKMTLKSDLSLIQKQVSVNDEFLKKIVDDPSLAERLAQRQLKRVRKGQHVLKIRDEKPDMSPFQITAVTPPPAPPPYKPLSGTIATLCYSARNRLYLTGIALAMIAFGLVLGATPQKSR